MIGSLHLDKESIKEIAKIIVEDLQDKKSVFANIQIEEESTQVDILFCYNYSNYGYHQSGIKNGYLLVGITHGGFHGFKLEQNPDTSRDYYQEKLKFSTPLLTMLINEVRSQLYMKELWEN